ncbi:MULTISPECIES: hypothetical protein [Clostridium]|uniref:Uncharacterized protein n=1 Tax=Clostridium tagluense TaxID=360422 RepID=A0A401UNA0_9CLOT|nr:MULTISPECIES: hypothetical protein [Clostridium]MBZ9636961.1 hypothetical protein [Clostridium sp. FP1]GCD11014.1 hypothetical protein Ctaglu_26370 [Clostridium tagluense]
MKRKNTIATIIFSILFLGSIYVHFTNNNRIKDTTIENNSLKIEFQSLKSENQTLKKVNNQLLETNAKVSEKVNKLKLIIN